MSSKSERRAAREVVWTYHEAQLAVLVDRVGEAIDSYRVRERDPYEVDEVLHHYSRSAKELWKFCNLLPVETAAAIIRREAPDDWWERGTPSQR